MAEPLATLELIVEAFPTVVLLAPAALQEDLGELAEVLLAHGYAVELADSGGNGLAAARARGSAILRVVFEPDGLDALVAGELTFDLATTSTAEISSVLLTQLGALENRAHAPEPTSVDAPDTPSLRLLSTVVRKSNDPLDLLEDLEELEDDAGLDEIAATDPPPASRSPGASTSAGVSSAAHSTASGSTREARSSGTVARTPGSAGPPPPPSASTRASIARSPSGSFPAAHSSSRAPSPSGSFPAAHSSSRAPSPSGSFPAAHSSGLRHTDVDLTPTDAALRLGDTVERREVSEAVVLGSVSLPSGPPERTLERRSAWPWILLVAVLGAGAAGVVVMQKTPPAAPTSVPAPASSPPSAALAPAPTAAVLPHAPAQVVEEEPAPAPFAEPPAEVAAVVPEIPAEDPPEEVEITITDLEPSSTVAVEPASATSRRTATKTVRERPTKATAPEVNPAPRAPPEEAPPPHAEEVLSPAERLPDVVEPRDDESSAAAEGGSPFLPLPEAPDSPVPAAPEPPPAAPSPPPQ